MAYSSTVTRTPGSHRLAAAVLALDQRLGDVQSTLDHDESKSSEETAATLLHDVERRLGDLAARLPDESLARRLTSVRDGLSSHLLAASTCERGGLPRSVVVQLLRRGADRTRHGVRSTLTVDRDGFATQRSGG